MLKRFLRNGHLRPPVRLELRAYWAWRTRKEAELGNRRHPVALAVAATLAVAPVETGGRALPSDPVLLAAGDIAACGSDGDERTAALLDSNRGTVLALGDIAYDNGTLEEFQACFGPSWGRHTRRIRPAPGNHEYNSDASGYFRYFGRAAGPAGRGYYSFDLASWHVVSLNSERDTDAGGAQVRWLRADLARTRARCVLAFWHRPRWTSGQYADDARMAPLWNALYDARADIVLSGHDHNYQRYPPMNKRGAVDKARGIRSFVVGTGGRHRYELRADSRRRAANDSTWGVLKLTLRPADYRWRFVPVAGGGYRDSGSGACSPR
jgi:acid phosphatase type 7